MNKISVPSRIILALVSLSLIVLFFTPIWRIDLFAPQYPGGLTMKIWIDTLKGDVDVINGLNHYIGMRHISVEMFPEFEFLKYVVGFYILLGLAVAIIGNRVILFWYNVFTVFGGVFAAYDFYRWGYEYGHNLDPMAPIQIPGLSYQPPLLGHKRLLNFDAYSFPDIGGWFVIIAASTFFLVWLFEKYKIHKKIFKRKPAVAILMFMVILASCSSKPEPFKYGTDICYSCKMGIADQKFGGEVVTKKGKAYKFDDVGCMIGFLNSGYIDENEIKHKVVIDYEKGKEFIPVSSAVFVKNENIRSPMNSHIAAVLSNEAAKKLFGDTIPVMNWESIIKNSN